MRLNRWTSGEREAPEPLEGNVVATVTGGTVLWFALFLVQLPFYGWFADHGRTWWLWTCLTGGLLGLYGIRFVRRREAALDRARRDGEPKEPEQPEQPENAEKPEGTPADHTAPE